MPKSLVRSARQFAIATELLRIDFTEAISTTYADPRHRAHIAKFAIISLLDKWSKFCRSLIIESAVGAVETGSGTRLPRVHYRIQRDAMIAVRQTKRGTIGDEPRWHDATIAIAAARKLSIPNLTTVSLTIGDANSPADAIRLLRNVCAHESSGDCFKKAKANLKIAVLADRTMVDCLGSRVPDGRRVYDYWIDDLQALAFAAVR